MFDTIDEGIDALWQIDNVRGDNQVEALLIFTGPIAVVETPLEHLRRHVLMTCKVSSEGKVCIYDFKRSYTDVGEANSACKSRLLKLE